MPICAIVGCSKRYQVGEGVRLFSLPTVNTNQCKKTLKLSSKGRAVCYPELTENVCLEGRRMDLDILFEFANDILSLVRCEEGGLVDTGTRYTTDRHSPIERYVPGPRYDRYPVQPVQPVSPAPGGPSRYVDPYARRDLFSPAAAPPPPPPSRYLRPIHRYTPRPTRIEYRTHVEYLGSSGGRSVQTDFASHGDSGCVDVFEQDHSPEDLFRATLYINTPRTPREREYSRTPPLGRSPGGGGSAAEPVERGRCSAESQTPPVAVATPLSLCCSTPRRVLPSAPAQPTALTSQHHHHTPTNMQHSSNIWRTVSQAPSPPSPSPSPPSQTTTSSPPSVLDSGVYSRSSGPSSEAPSTCSTTTGGGSTVPSGSPQSSGASSGSSALIQPPPVVRSMSEDPTLAMTMGVPTADPTPHRVPRLLQHQQSLPVTQAEVASNQQRAFNRSNSRSDIIKQKLKKNAAIFFGVDADTEQKEKCIWMGRRKRLASRRYGELKPEYREALTPNIDQRQPTPQSLQPDVCPTLPGRDEGDASPRWPLEQPPARQKPSVASMTFKGVAYLAAALNKHRSQDSLSRGLRSTTRSYSPSLIDGAAHTGGIPSDDDEVFFDRSSGTETVLPAAPPPADFVDSTSEPILTTVPVRESRHGSWKRAAGEGLGRRDGTGSQVGLSRISGIDLDRAHDNSDRRQFGQGIIHRLFGRSLKRSVMSREPVKEVLEDLEDHRPFFTYWLSTVQILILAISLVSYGFGPFGMDLHHQSSLVLVTSLSLQQVDFTEPANFWLGPRAADLIHLGAKFAPCMRRDAKITKEIEKGREKERETACCIRNDDSGCVQSSKSECSDTISTWKKWGHTDAGPGGRISGSVCGLDPKYCEAPASVAPYEWPDDITKWPICRKTSSSSSSSSLQRKSTKHTAAEHMACEVIGHPCCIGIHATCRITTKEYCDFVHGHFHDEASLCSQVSCLDDVCGMLPFINAEVPDQFYRLLTSIFLHAGLVQLGISLWIQWFLMRDLEKLTGTSRIIIIYIGSGVAGNLASAIFVPYRADVGPAGSQSGLLACLIVEILNMWPMLKHPYYALFKHLLIALFLFIIGLLPWFDNFSSFFGFIFGFLLSYAILPFVSLGEYDRQKKIFLIWVCLVTTAFLFLLLVLFFYVIPVYDCEVCGYFNCLPLTRDFCSTQNINFKRSDAV